MTLVVLTIQLIPTTNFKKHEVEFQKIKELPSAFYI